jgi:hypothetical protein
MSTRGKARSLLRGGAFHVPPEVSVNLLCLRVFGLGNRAKNHRYRGNVLAYTSEVRNALAVVDGVLVDLARVRARHSRGAGG